MNRKLVTMLGLVLGFLALGVSSWAQAPDAAPPPPPPDGRFFFVRGEPMFEGLKAVTGAPFSAQASTQTVQTLADGNQINHTETAEVYRDSAGRTRRDATLSHIGPWSAATTPRKLVDISDPVAGVRYLLDANDKTAVKMPDHGPRGRGLDVPRTKRLHEEAADLSNIQRTTESLGTQVMAGVTVQGTRTTETIAAGAIGNRNPIVVVSERWTSPDLQVLVYSKRTDPRFGVTIYQLSNISRQEPDATLFQVPADYTIKEGPPRP